MAARSAACRSRRGARRRPGLRRAGPRQVHGRVRAVQVDGLPPILVYGRTHGCVQGRALVGYQQRDAAGCRWRNLARQGWGLVGAVEDRLVGHGASVHVRCGCGDDDAAVPGFRVEDRVQAAGIQARDQALDQREVHVADQLGLPFRQVAERAVPHPDGAGLVLPRLEAVLGQRALQSQPLAVALGIIGTVPLTEVGAQLPGGVMQRGPGPATAVGRDRLDQQARRQLILPGRDGHHELAAGPRVDLGRTAGTRSAAAWRPPVGGRQQSGLHELVQVVDGQRAADAHRGRRLVPSDRLGAAGHERVQAAADPVVQTAQRGQVCLVLRQAHSCSLSSVKTRERGPS